MNTLSNGFLTEVTVFKLLVDYFIYIFSTVF